MYQKTPKKLKYIFRSPTHCFTFFSDYLLFLEMTSFRFFFLFSSTRRSGYPSIISRALHFFLTVRSFCRREHDKIYHDQGYITTGLLMIVAHARWWEPDRAGINKRNKSSNFCNLIRQWCECLFFDRRNTNSVNRIYL